MISNTSGRSCFRLARDRLIRSIKVIRRPIRFEVIGQ